MLESGRDLDLAQGALGAVVGRQVGMEHLDRHRAVVLHVMQEA